MTDSVLMAMSKYKNLVRFSFGNGDRSWVIVRVADYSKEIQDLRFKLKSALKNRQILINDLKNRPCK